jgi:hypothetical protein
VPRTKSGNERINSDLELFVIAITDHITTRTFVFFTVIPRCADDRLRRSER